MTREKQIIWTARVLSALFAPTYLPFVGLVLLFMFSYLSMMPLGFKAEVLCIVYFFTIFLPTALIALYRRHQGWTLTELGQKERRMVPYVISILCYFACIYLMEQRHIPHFMGSIVISALIIQILCALVNVSWKISTHTAAIGGVAGALLAFSLFFNFNPVWWLCLVVLLAGMLGTSRMTLRQHTLPQVVAGFWLGLLAAFWGVLLL